MRIDELVVSPSDEFYTVYSPAQVGAVLDSLTENREFPHALTFLGSGVAIWKDRVALATPEDAALIRQADALISDHVDEIVALLPARQPVEVIDLGPGAGEPVTSLLERLSAQGRLARYRGIDISPGLLAILRERLHAVVPPDRVDVCAGDFTGPDLDRILGDGSAADDGPARLVILSGNTLCNLVDPAGLLRRIAGALSARDRLVLTIRIDNGSNRPPFMDQVMVGGPISVQHTIGPSILGIAREWYEPERRFDAERREVQLSARFVRPVTLVVGKAGTERRISFAAGDSMLLYRHLFLDRDGLVELLAQAGLSTRSLVTDESGEAVLLTAGPTRAGG